MSKTARLAQLLSKSGKLNIAAIDHRGHIKALLHPENPENTTDQEIIEWKNEMIKIDKSVVSGILIDPKYGQNLIDKTLPCGWMLSLEKSGYRGSQLKRVTELYDDFSVAKAKEWGACSVKLLLYYDTEDTLLARAQKKLAIRVAQDCSREGIVFLLEPLSYNATTDPYKIERIVDDLIDVEVDIFKIEYPGDAERCRRISDKLNVPWVLLSAGVGYEQYKEQLTIACQNGASGMAVGRAAWQELGQYEGESRSQFLDETVAMRMRELVGIVEQYGKSV